MTIEHHGLSNFGSEGGISNANSRGPAAAPPVRDLLIGEIDHAIVVRLLNRWSLQWKLSRYRPNFRS